MKVNWKFKENLKKIIYELFIRYKLSISLRYWKKSI